MYIKKEESWPKVSKVIILGETLPSWNKMYAGVHWSKRKREADKWHKLVFYEAKRQRATFIKQSGRSLEITIVCYFANYRKRLDADNICAKLAIDGLKGVLIEDDDWKHVIRVITETRVDSESPRTEIVVSKI